MSNLNQHVKSDKVKWIVTGIVLVLILAILGGVVAAVVTETNPKEWFEKPVEEQPEQQYYTFSRELTCLDDIIGLTYDSEYDWTMVEKHNTTPSQEVYAYTSFIYVEGFSAPFADFEEYVDTLTHAQALKVKINGEPMTLVGKDYGESKAFIAMDETTSVVFMKEFGEYMMGIPTLMLMAQSETEIESLEIVEIVENFGLELGSYLVLEGMKFDSSSDCVVYYGSEVESILSVYIAGEDNEEFFSNIDTIKSITVKVDDVEYVLPCTNDSWGPEGYVYSDDDLNLNLKIGYGFIAPDTFVGTAITIYGAPFETFEIVSFNN